MKIKEKFIGLVLVVVGVLPFLLRIKRVGDFFESYGLFNLLVPGELIYQVVIIVLGVLLIWTVRPKVELRR